VIVMDRSGMVSVRRSAVYVEVCVCVLLRIYQKKKNDQTKQDNVVLPMQVQVVPIF